MIYAAVRAVVLLCVIGSSPAAAFQAGLSGRPAIAQRASAVVLAETVMDTTPGAVAEDCGCAEESGGVLMNDVRVTGRTLRNTLLADANGGRSSVGGVRGAPRERAAHPGEAGVLRALRRGRQALVRVHCHRQRARRAAGS